MDDFFSKYGWTVAVGVIIIIAITMVAPVGNEIKKSETEFTTELGENAGSFMDGYLVFEKGFNKYGFYFDRYYDFLTPEGGTDTITAFVFHENGDVSAYHNRTFLEKTEGYCMYEDGKALFGENYEEIICFADDGKSAYVNEDLTENRLILSEDEYEVIVNE